MSVTIPAPDAPASGDTLATAVAVTTSVLPTNAAQETGGNLASITAAVQKLGKSIGVLGYILPSAGYQGQLSLNSVGVTGAHIVSGVKARNLNTTGVLYLQFFDATSTQSNTAIPKFQVMVGFGGSGVPTENAAMLNPDFVSFTTGVWYAWSTTDGVLTLLAAGGSANLTGEVLGL